MNPFGHMDVRVADLTAAQPFYDALLPALGFTERHHGETWKVWATVDPLPGTAYFGITESPEHTANENRDRLLGREPGGRRARRGRGS